MKLPRRRMRARTAGRVIINENTCSPALLHFSGGLLPLFPLPFERFVTTLYLLLARAVSLHNYRHGLQVCIKSFPPIPINYGSCVVILIRHKKKTPMERLLLGVMHELQTRLQADLDLFSFPKYNNLCPHFLWPRSHYFYLDRGHFQTRSSEEVPDLVCSYKSKMRA
jgi:hypothetical protein